LIKGTTHQENIKATNIYTLKVSAPNFVKKTPLCIKEKIDPDTIIVCDFNTIFLSIDISFRQKFKKHQS
jgi:hypothetical protein